MLCKKYQRESNNYIKIFENSFGIIRNSKSLKDGNKQLKIKGEEICIINKEKKTSNAKMTYENENNNQTFRIKIF